VPDMKALISAYFNSPERATVVTEPSHISTVSMVMDARDHNMLWTSCRSYVNSRHRAFLR